MANGHEVALRALGRLARSVGQWADAVGVALQGSEAYVERLVPSTRVTAHKGKELKHGSHLFMAQSASVVGDVTIGELSGVYYGAVVRGDVNPVKVGRNVSIQDNAIVQNSRGHPMTVIGDDVVIAPGAHVTSATIDDGAMIGMGARVGPGCKIGKDAYVDAGAVLPEGTVVPPGQLWTGSPAHHLRDLSVDEMAFLRTQALTYGQVATRHAEQHAKTLQEVEYDAYLQEWRDWNYMKPEDPLPQVAPEMVEYYTLTRAQSVAADQGIFREREYDDDALRLAAEAEEDAADAAEEEYHQNVATLDTVYEGIKQLTSTRAKDAAGRSAVLAHIGGRDERALIYLEDLLARVHEGASDEAAAAALRDELYNLDPHVWVEAKGVDVDAHFAALAAHAAELAAGHGGALKPGALAALAAELEASACDVSVPTPEFAATMKDRPTR